MLLVCPYCNRYWSFHDIHIAVHIAVFIVFIFQSRLKFPPCPYCNASCSWHKVHFTVSHAVSVNHIYSPYRRYPCRLKPSSRLSSLPLQVWEVVWRVEHRPERNENDSMHPEHTGIYVFSRKIRQTGDAADTTGRRPCVG